MKRPRSGQQGHTLVELVVTVALMMVVLVPILMTVRNGQQSAGDLQKNTEVRAQVRFAIDIMARDFREAQLRGTAAGKEAVGSFSSTKITFYAPDRSTPYRLRMITYEIVGTKLKRSSTPSNETATPTGGLPNWTWPTAVTATEFAFNLLPGSFFSAKDGSGATTTTPKDIRRLDATLVVNGLPRPGAAQTFKQSVEMRSVV